MKYRSFFNWPASKASSKMPRDGFSSVQSSWVLPFFSSSLRRHPCYDTVLGGSAPGFQVHLIRVRTLETIDRDIDAQRRAALSQLPTCRPVWLAAMPFIAQQDSPRPTTGSIGPSPDNGVGKQAEF